MDVELRKIALELAIQANADDVVAEAERFYAFLIKKDDNAPVVNGLLETVSPVRRLRATR